MSLPAVERTLIVVKPDATAKGFVGDIIGRFEEARPEAGGRSHADGLAGQGRAVLFRSQGQAVLRRPGGLHQRRPQRRRHPRRQGRDRGGQEDDRLDPELGSRARHDKGRFSPPDFSITRSRLRLERVLRVGEQDLLLVGAAVDSREAI